MLVKLTGNCLFVYSYLDFLYLRKMLYLRKIEIFVFAEKSQNIAFSKQIGFSVFDRRIDCASAFCFSRADREIQYPDFCENAVCWQYVTRKLEIWCICGNPLYLRKNISFSNSYLLYFHKLSRNGVHVARLSTLQIFYE